MVRRFLRRDDAMEDRSGEEPGWRAAALQKTLNEVASLCSLTFYGRSKAQGPARAFCQRAATCRRTAKRCRATAVQSGRAPRRVSFPYHWNQSGELCEHCNWKQIRGKMIGNRSCKMLAFTGLRMWPAMSRRGSRRQNVRLLFAFCSLNFYIFL